jgi:hypothetical protein
MIEKYSREQAMALVDGDTSYQKEFPEGYLEIETELPHQ